MTIRGLLIWYLGGVACVGGAGASAYHALQRPHAPAVAAVSLATIAPQPAPAVLAAEPTLPAPAPRPAAAAPSHTRVAEALPLPPVPPSYLPPLRRHIAAATPASRRPPGKEVASVHRAPDQMPRFVAAPPPPYPGYAMAPAHYASAQAYYYPYYLYYRAY